MFPNYVSEREGGFGEEGGEEEGEGEEERMRLREIERGGRKKDTGTLHNPGSAMAVHIGCKKKRKERRGKKRKKEGTCTFSKPKYGSGFSFEKGSQDALLFCSTPGEFPMTKKRREERVSVLT